MGERQVHDDQGDADGGGDQQRADEHGAQLHRLAAPERLRGEPRRAHAQRAEDPEHEVEQQRADRHRAEQHRVAQPADGAGGDQPQQRRRHLRQRRRQGDGEEAPGSDLHPARDGERHEGQRPRLARRVISQSGMTIAAPSRK